MRLIFFPFAFNLSPRCSVIIFSPSIEWCVSVTSLLVPCCLEEGTHSQKTQLDSCSYSRLFVCFHCEDLTRDTTRTSSMTVWHVFTSQWSHQKPRLVYIIGIQKRNANTRKRCRHTGSSHILWEVNNSYCACDDRREQTCSLSSASLIAAGTCIDFSYKHRWVLLSSFHVVISLSMWWWNMYRPANGG